MMLDNTEATTADKGRGKQRNRDTRLCIKWENMVVGRIFSRGGGDSGFFSRRDNSGIVRRGVKIFPGGAESGEISFFALKTKKTTVFLQKML